jgi:RNA polymerase sigma factor (sigma-70 family)
VRIDREDRDVVAQLAFIRLLGMLKGFRGEHLLQFYKAIRPCVHYACLDFLSKKHRQGETVPLPDEDQPGGQVADDPATDPIDQIGLRDALDRAMAQMKNLEHREVLRLTFFEDMSSAEIAKRMSLEINTVDQHRRRGLRWLGTHHPHLASLLVT